MTTRIAYVNLCVPNHGLCPPPASLKQLHVCIIQLWWHYYVEHTHMTGELPGNHFDLA